MNLILHPGRWLKVLSLIILIITAIATAFAIYEIGTAMTVFGTNTKEFWLSVLNVFTTIFGGAVIALFVYSFGAIVDGIDDLVFYQKEAFDRIPKQTSETNDNQKAVGWNCKVCGRHNDIVRITCRDCGAHK